MDELVRQNQELRQELAKLAGRLDQIGDIAEKAGEPVLAEFARRWAAEAEAAAGQGEAREART